MLPPSPTRPTSALLTLLLAAWGATLALPLPALSQGVVGAPACGSLRNGYGPFDYLTDKDKLGIVEQYHFTPEVEMLVRGSTGPTVGGELDYTLRAFPNHHRALLAMERLGEREHTPQPAGAPRPVECYFERALRFRPHDTTARLLYANFLFHNQRKREALGQMDVVGAAAEDDGPTHYTMGLMYLENQLYAQAQEHARKAYALGITQPGLRDALQHLGHGP